MTLRKQFLIAGFSLLTPVIIYSAYWLFTRDLEIRDKFEQKTFLSPTQFYSNTLTLKTNQQLPEKVFLDLLRRNEYRQKQWGSTLQPSDFAFTTGAECEKIYSQSLKCYAFHHHQENKINLVATDELDTVLVLLEVDPQTQKSEALTQLLLFPQLFAQYLGTSPVIQERVPLNQVPRLCLDAALAVEDPLFLEHQGVSLKGLARAFWVNLTSLRLAQGGSTITQQLVKNHFLTAEKRLSRKFKEILMALILEARVPKDQILETYLNIIYLGQQGNFQVRGYGAAADFYFNKSLEQLNLSECALLAAVINSPGAYNPFRHPEKALQRREKVLRDMAEQNRILPEDLTVALAQPLPTKKNIEIRETAPYFITGAVKELERIGYTDLSGFKIFTTLDLSAQAAAQKSVQTHLNQLENSSDYHKKNKAHSLQAVLVSSDPQTGDVLALVGGRDHRLTPFNRVFEGRRQVGSIFKPLVYLTAFDQLDEFSPLSPLENTPFKHKYERQVWEPHNYDNSTTELPVPAFYALKESLNIPTARLGIDVGLDTVVEVAQDLGITSPLKPFPALTLGAFESTPFEVLQVYTTLARWGSKIPLKLVKKVQSLEGEIIWEPDDDVPEQVLSVEDFANTTALLQEAMLTGTGQSARARGVTWEIAGKTGTTSNYKDAWFAGYSANHVAVVWTGYDDNTPVKLSGSSGALPIWTDYMLAMMNLLPAESFAWPEENRETVDISTEELLKFGIPENKAQPTKILFYKK